MNPPPVFCDVQNYLNEYLAFPDFETKGADQSLICGLWVFHTWTFSPAFPRTPWTTPYLYVHSPEKQSGKTLLLTLLQSLTRQSVSAGAGSVSMTPATLFRLIDSRRPTLFMDEIDTLWTTAGNEPMRGLVNAGYKHGGSVWRLEWVEPETDDESGGKRAKVQEPVEFQVFCAKLLAGIDNERLPDTVRDRCIPIRLRRKSEDEKRTTYYSFQAEPIAEALAKRIEEWTLQNGEAIANYLPDNPIPGISPRAWEIAIPLVQVARAMGLEKEARGALARLLAPQPEKDSPNVRVLREIKALFDQTKTDKLHTEQIVNHLNETIGAGWNGKALYSRVLRHYDISPASLMDVNGKTNRGYYRHQFEDPWQRYL